MFLYVEALALMGLDLRLGRRDDDLLGHNISVLLGQEDLHRPDAIPSEFQKKVDEPHLVVDDFIRTFLLRMGMERTLDSFDTEWYAP